MEARAPTCGRLHIGTLDERPQMRDRCCVVSKRMACHTKLARRDHTKFDVLGGRVTFQGLPCKVEKFGIPCLYEPITPESNQCATEPSAIAKLAREHLSLLHHRFELLKLPGLKERSVNIEQRVDPTTHILYGGGQPIGSRDRLLATPGRLRQRTPRVGLSARFTQVIDGLFPELCGHCVVGQGLCVLGETSRIHALHGHEDSSVQDLSSVAKECAVRHLVRQRMLERVQGFRKGPNFPEQFCSL